ncbi:unnamed protein product [Hydatigera taeniaeformis]|uniref:DNA mismatch repair protein n=1 Tax=Hydatigena taeniaeformis TaxID=6205 RepID=A0A0R3WJK9_HYDTA|nr:unnamed protein product [Hydatigera taeniaeformis]
MAVIDLNQPGIEVSQFTDTSGYGSTLMKMLVWMPTEVLLPQSALEQSSNMNRLVKLLQQSEFGCAIVGVGRHSFNNQEGLEYLKALCHPHYLPSIYAFQEKYYGLSAAAALFNYLETTKRVYYAPKSLKVDFRCSTQATMLDATSAIRLGLVSRLGRARESQTLFKAINHTCTLIGARRLRGCLLEPPNDLTTITCRQESVTELISKPQILLEIQTVLAKFPAIDSLLSMCVHLSEFPAPRTDLLTGTAASACSVITSSSGAAFRQRPTSLSGDDAAEEELLTPSSDVERDHRPKRLCTGTASASNISPLAPTSNLALRRRLSEKDSSGATSSLFSAVSIGNNAELRITKLIAIKHMLDLIQPLQDALKGTSSALLKTYREPGINVLLDLTRRAYAEQVDDISQYVKGLASEYTLPLRVGYNKARGFFIQIPEQALCLPPAPRSRCFEAKATSNLVSESTNCSRSNGPQSTRFSIGTQLTTKHPNLPDVFIKVQVSRGLINCTTAELVKLNERVKGSLNEVYLIADNLACKLIHDLHPEMSLFYRLSEAISGLDLLCSLARIVVSAPPGHCFGKSQIITDRSDTCPALLVKPVFGDTLAIQEGRHMIKDRFSECLPVSNNTSGKTTYLTQVALMQILAQIGAFVPAKFAAFRLTDKIFVRMGCRDDMSTKASTFALEMREVGHILRSATDNSLVMIDDLGLSTTDEDCFTLSYAICDALAKMRAFSFFTSSDASLSQLQFIHLNVEIYHFEVETRGAIQGGQRIYHSRRADCSLDDSYKSTSFNDSSIMPGEYEGAPTVDGTECAKDGDTRTLYRFTYRLRKGVGKITHCVIDQIGLTAMDPDLISITKKYYNILMSGKTSKINSVTHSDVVNVSHSTTDPVSIAGVEQVRRSESATSKGDQEEETETVTHHITSEKNEERVGKVGNQVSPSLYQSYNFSEGKERDAIPRALVIRNGDPDPEIICKRSEANCMLDGNNSWLLFLQVLEHTDLNVDVAENAPRLTTLTPPTQLPANQTSKSCEDSQNGKNRDEDFRQENVGEAATTSPGEVTSEERGVTSVDRMAYRLMQQVQMLACVVRYIERASTSAPDGSTNQKNREEDVRAAQQDVLLHLAFLRDRYAAVLKHLKED